MTKHVLVTALCILAPGALGAVEPQATLTLESAQRLATDRSPSLVAASARVSAAAAELLGARIYPINPEIEASSTRRANDQRQTNEYEIGISQGLEIAGQRGKRIAVAEAALEAAQSHLDRARQVLSALVESRFADALAAHELARLAELEHRIAAELTAFESRRLDAGAATQIDLNLALAVEGRSERNLQLAAAAETGARARLAEAIGLVPSELGTPSGAAPISWPAIPTLDELERAALEARPDLIAARLESAASSALVRLERATAVPNITFGAASGREEATDDLTIFSVGIAIPLFDRNQGAIATARAAQSEQAATRSALELSIRREVAEARSLLEATIRGRAALAERVEGTLEENLSLLQKALAAGKLRASEVLVFRRELLDSRRELIEASTEAWQARIALDLATGRTPQPPTPQKPTTSEPTP